MSSNALITNALTIVITMAENENKAELLQEGHAATLKYNWTQFRKQRAAINTCRRLLKSLQVFQPSKKGQKSK